MSERRSKQERKAETIHRKKLFDGQRTADDIHRQYAFATHERCAGCKGPPAIRIRVLVAKDELLSRNPEGYGLLCALSPTGAIPLIPTKYGDMIMTTNLAFCDHCRSQAEKAAAHGPSWAITEIVEGPGKDKVHGQVPRSYENGSGTDVG